MNQKHSKSKDGLPNPRGRNRLLNVIYFVDSNKTHSFKIKLKNAYWILGSLTILLCWSLASSYLLIEDIRKNNIKNKQTRNLLSTIFEYQSHYDHVYEKAYPNHSNTAIAESKTDSSTNSIIKKTDNLKQIAQKKVNKEPIKVSKKVTSMSAKELINKKTTKATLSIKKAVKQQKTRQKELASANKEYPVVIDTIKSNLSKNNLLVKFFIRNTNRPNRQAGYVWSVASFQDSKGNITKIAAPNYVKIDNKEYRKDLKQGYRFSIRYYKVHNFKFAAPPNTEGKFISARIHLANGKKNIASYDVKIDQQATNK